MLAPCPIQIPFSALLPLIIRPGASPESNRCWLCRIPSGVWQLIQWSTGKTETSPRAAHARRWSVADAAGVLGKRLGADFAAKHAQPDHDDWPSTLPQRIARLEATAWFKFGNTGRLSELASRMAPSYAAQMLRKVRHDCSKP